MVSTSIKNSRETLFFIPAEQQPSAPSPPPPISISCPQSDTEQEQRFLSKLYQLSDGRIHGDKRHNTVKTHLKHIEGNFVNFTKDEYRKFIVNWYVARLINNKTFSANYMIAVIDSINRFKQFERPPLSKREVITVIKNMKKIFNSESKDLLYYTRDFKPVKFTDTNVLGLRANNVVCKFSDKLYEEANLEIMLQYYKENLDNFLRLGYKQNIPSVEDDLALIVVFLASSPRRIQEILNLNLKKINDLIYRGQTVIISKNGENTYNMIVPCQFSKVLNDFLIATGREAQTNNVYSVHRRDMKLSREGEETEDENLRTPIVPSPQQRHHKSKNINEDNFVNDGTLLGSCDVPAFTDANPTDPNIDEYNEQALFSRSYFVYYKALKKQYRLLFGSDIGRPFHAFRNYFSAKYIKDNPSATRSALGHSSIKTTRSYANKQTNKNDIKNMTDFLTKIYPFSSTPIKPKRKNVVVS